MYGFELSGKDRKGANAGAAGSKNDAKAKKAKAVGNMLKRTALQNFSKAGDSRARMMAFLNMPNEVPQEVIDALQSGKARLNDMTLFSNKALADVTKFFESGDEKTPGLSNLKGNVIPKGYGFLVNSIRIRVGTAAGATELDAKQTDFKALLNAILGGCTGFVKFMAQNRAILQEMGTGAFINAPNSNTAPVDQNYGTYHLDNPRYIGDNGELSFEIQFPSTTGTTANTRIMVELIGSMIVPQ